MRRLSLLLLALAPCVFGYIRLTTSAAPPVFPLQRTDNTGIQFYLNNLVVPGATSSASGSNVTVITASSNPTQAIELAQAAWNSVTTANVNFLPVKSTTLTSDANDNTNVISIAASPSELSAVSGVVAITLNAFAVSASGASVNGNILDSDILLNPQDSFSTDGSTAYDLQTVLTHEFGHSLGANHSGLLGATMFQYSTINQTALVNERFLSMDDVTFVSEAYPAAGSAAPALGTISGRITVGGAPVPFALLTMIDTADGFTIGGLSNADGTYSVLAPPGSYVMYAEPFNAIVQPGNLYLTAAQTTLAQSVSFQSTFFGGNTNPTTVAVTANTTATANISVTSGATTLTPPVYFVVVPAGAAVTNVSGFFHGPVQIASGQTVDLGLVGAGYDSTLTSSNFLVNGAGVTVTKVAVDPTGTVGGLPLVRVTLTIAARSNADVASVFVSKGSNSLSLSGWLVITPPPPVFIPASLVSAASYLGSAPGKGGVSPGGYYSIYTPNGSPATLGPTPFVQNAGYDPYHFLSANLAGVSVTFDGVAAPLFFVFGGQINLQVPFEVAGKTSTNVVVNFFGSTNTPVPVPVISEQPAFFTTTPEGTDSLVYNTDGSTNSKTNPAARSTYVTAYGTGVGNVAGLVTGQGAPLVQALKYNCTIGSTTEPAAFVGWTPTAVALAQFTFQVPPTIAANSTQTLTCTDTATGVSTLPGTLYVGN